MATTRVKSTYSLPPESIDALERVARRWGVSRSEALARAIAVADESGPAPDGIAALDELQASLRLTKAKAAAWAQRVRDERRAPSGGAKRKR